MQEENQALLEVIEKFEDDARLKKMMKKAQSLYLMHSFKIKFMTRKEASEFYFRFLKKYKSGEFTTMPNQWYKNERRLFLWYLICYCEYNNLSIQKLSLEQWEEMGRIFFDKSPLFLKFQGLTIYKNIKRHAWNDSEDKLLEKFVAQLGTNEWNEVSKLLFFQNDQGNFISSKQCRQRWFNHVCKEINKDSWTPEQDIEVLRLSFEMGKKWSAIARELKTRRTEHMVKNRYVSIINKTRTNKRQSQQVLVKKAIKALEEIRDNSLSKEKQPDQARYSIGVNGEKIAPNIQLQNKISSSFIMNQVPIIEVSEKRQEQHQNIFCSSQGSNKEFDQQIKKFLFCVQDGSQKDSVQGTALSITPSTVKPISVSPFTFFNNFDSCALRFQKKRKDGSNLFSPYPATPIPSLGPSPFVQFRSTSFYSPVGISQLPFCDFRDKISKKQSKQSEQGV